MIASLIAVIGLLSFGFGIIFGDSRGCDGNSEAAEYARSLSQKRLSQLYGDMLQYHSKGESEHDDIHVHGNDDLPIEFSDLEVVRISPSRTHIMVEGCFDNYMYMQFKGIDDSGSKEILLTYGEFEAKFEKLWPK